MNVIETNALTKYYGQARGIVDLNLVIKEGDFFGFIGPNGAGKSTTIRVLLGLINLTSGSATVFGKNIQKSITEINRDVGYMPSEAIFYDGMKVRDLIAFSAALRKCDCRSEAESLCERLQLDTSRRIDELSFGNRKKVGIVCALQHSPRLLILDEPTSGLDPLMQREFFSILKERNRQGATIFLSSHVLAEIQRNCTTAAIIREGRLVACDKVENMYRTTAKRVSVHGCFDIDNADSRDIQRTTDGISFLYSGDINKLLGLLSATHITDLSISEPSLEEIFLHYYGEEDIK